jgi:hypothetical protein
LHWQGLLAVLALAGVWVPAVGNPAELLTFVAVLAIAVLVEWRGPGRLAPAVGVRARVMRQRAHRSAFLRTRDPDAAGRVRPRAPGQRAV